MYWFMYWFWCFSLVSMVSAIDLSYMYISSRVCICPLHTCRLWPCYERTSWSICETKLERFSSVFFSVSRRDKLWDLEREKHTEKTSPSTIKIVPAPIRTCWWRKPERNWCKGKVAWTQWRWIVLTSRPSMMSPSMIMSWEIFEIFRITWM